MNQRAPDLQSVNSVIGLYGNDAIPQAQLEAEIKRLRDEEAEAKQQIDELLKQRKRVALADKVTLKLSEHADRLRSALPATIGPEGKREFLTIYNVGGVAGQGDCRFWCNLGALLLDSEADYDEPFFEGFAAELAELERLHPDLSIADFADYAKALPGDHPLAKRLNILKDKCRPAYSAKPSPASVNRSYTTIGQTSAL